MRAPSPSPSPGRRPGSASPAPPPFEPVWPALAHKARLLFAQWSSAAADARRALALADHVRARLGALLMVLPPSNVADDDEHAGNNKDAMTTKNTITNDPWSACGRALCSSNNSNSDSAAASTTTAQRIRGRVVDAHLRDIEEELRRAATARTTMAESSRSLGRLAAAASSGAAALSPPAARALAARLAPGPGPFAVAEAVQDVWRACVAETQLHEAAAARCAVPAVDDDKNRGGGRRGSGPSAAAASWAAALAVLEAEVNLGADRARFESFFDAVQQSWPS